MENDGVIRLQKAQAEFSVMTPKSSNRALFSQELKWRSFMGADSLKSSVSSDSGHLVHFDLFERQGFDRIMQTVANSAIEQEDIAKCICEMLETVSALSMAT